MKSRIRHRVWYELRQVALPDSRHHWDFDNFIADFNGSDRAVARLTRLPVYQNADILFVAPDNCLELLRWKCLLDGKTILMTTYGIRRGFWLLDPALIQPRDYRYAATLDGMERVAQPVTLQDIRTNYKGGLGLLVTGSGAINTHGVRFGKGHGFFDLEWAMLWSVGAVSISRSVIVAIVHDCQLLDEELQPEDFDTVCDVVITPTRTVEVSGVRKKPELGIIWPLLQTGMLENIPPLRELKVLQENTII